MTISRRSVEPLQHSAAVLLITFAAIALSPCANAAPFVWDPNLLTAGAQDGGGDWDTGTSNWLDQANNVIWANSNEAIFGAGSDGAYAVAVALNPTATGLTFNSSGYTLSAPSAQTIVVTSVATSITVANTKTATIGSNVTVSSPASATNSMVTGGGLMIIESGGVLRNNGTQSSNVLRIAGSAGGGTGTTLQINPGGSFTNNLNNTALFVSGTVLVNGGSLNLAVTSTGGTLGIGQDSADSAGTVTISSGTISAPSTNGIRFGSNSGSTPGGTLNINGGVVAALRLLKGTGTVTTSVVNFNGGTLKTTGTTTTFIENLTQANVRNAGAIFDVGHIVTLNQPLLHSTIPNDNDTDGGLTKNGVSTLILGGANTYNGGTTLNAGTLSVSNDNRLGDSAGALNFNGGALQVTGTTFNSTPRVINWSGNSGFDIADAANVFTVTQNLTSGAGLRKGGAGTLVLAGENGYSGTTQLNAGTLRLAHNRALGESSILVPPGNQLQLTNNITVDNQVRVGGIGTGNDGVLKNLSGANTLTNVGISGSDGTRIHVVSGSSLNIPNDIFLDAGGTAQSLRVIGAGTLELSGSNQAFLQSGNSVLLGDGTNAGPTLKLGNELALGTSTLNFQANSESTLQSANAFQVELSNSVALNATSTTFGASGTGNLLFTGNAILGSNLIATINNAVTTFSAGINETGGPRSLTKAGAGALILTGANNYSGATNISLGTLFVNGSLAGSLSPTMIAPGATLAGIGTIQPAVSVAGTLSPGDFGVEVGKLTLASNDVLGALDLSGGTLLWQLGSLLDDDTGFAGFDFDQVELSGIGANLKLGGTSNLTLSFGAGISPESGAAFWNTDHIWTIINGAAATNFGDTQFASLTNATFAQGNFSAFADADGTVTLSYVAVPEPMAAWMLVGSLAMVGLRRRR